MIRNRHFSLAAFLILSAGLPVFSQTTPAPQPPKTARAATAQKTAENRTGFPQVVTVVHRLNGLKMFRLLLRSQQEIEAIANLDETFTFTEDVHTNVIAGLALEDGQTVAVWLPEAEVEFPRTFVYSEARTPRATTPAPPPAEFKNRFFASPDLTVIDSNGKKIPAEFVGLDGATGLSILRLAGGIFSTSPPNVYEPVRVGEDVRLLGPEPVVARRPFPTNLYVRIGEAPGVISNVTQAPTGDIARFKVRSPRVLSSENIGGIAVSWTGETVGIVDSVDGTEASILPADLIRRAAKRVLSVKASVPKPWLGVKGEAVAAVNAEQMEKLGWELFRANTLAQEHRGILLTWIAPDSPAALAALRAGDVILKVNDEYIQSTSDFSWLLDQAGPANKVEFTIARPDKKAEEAISVKLSSAPAMLARRPSGQMRPPKDRWLIEQGIETIAVRPAVAARLGASSGLLIVFVEPGTVAFEAGLQPGDVIQSINGRPALPASGPMLLSPANNNASTFEIVRKKQKMTIAVAKPK